MYASNRLSNHLELKVVSYIQLSSALESTSSSTEEPEISHVTVFIDATHSESHESDSMSVCDLPHALLIEQRTY